MKRILALLLLAAATALAAPSARLERDLGLGLGYCRVHTLPADLPLAAAKPRPLVLDLRYARGDDSAAAVLGAWLKFHSSAATPVFVLVNAETAPAILSYFTALEPPAGLVTLGPASPAFAPDIPLKISPATERAAYDALETGTPIDGRDGRQHPRPARGGARDPGSAPTPDGLCLAACRESPPHPARPAEALSGGPPGPVNPALRFRQNRVR